MGGRSSDKDPKPEPNLELPSFRLRRKKKPAEPSPLTPERSLLTPEPSVVTPEPSVEPTVGGPSVRVPPPPPARTAPTMPAAAGRTAPPPPASTRRQPPAPPPPTAAVVPDEATLEMPLAEDATTEPARPPKPPRTPKSPKPAKEARPPRQPKAAKPPKPRPAPKPTKAARGRSVAPLAWLPGYVAAIFTGALCGGLTVVLAWGTSQGCAQLRGVGTCGGYGVVALVIILGIDVVIATGLLRLFRIIDPATTALLGVGLVAVLAMLFFLGQTQSFAMVYVIPILMAATFTFAWGITKAIAQRVED